MNQPCIPKTLQQLAAEAERRRDEVVERLIQRTGEELPLDRVSFEPATAAPAREERR